MKLSKFIISVLISITSAVTANASGCMWYDEYELGDHLGTLSVDGTFSCSEYDPGWSRCIFTTAGDHPIQLKSDQFFRDFELPPLDQSIEITIASYEAMHWNNCDGGDEVPPYVKNGIYDFFVFDGKKYERFKQL